MSDDTISHLFADCTFPVRDILSSLVESTPINMHSNEDYLTALCHTQSRLLRRRFWKQLAAISPCAIPAIGERAAAIHEDTAEEISQLSDDFKQIAFNILLKVPAPESVTDESLSQKEARRARQTILFQCLLPFSIDIDFTDITPQMIGLIASLLKHERNVVDGPIHLKFDTPPFYTALEDIFVSNDADSDVVKQSTLQLLSLLPSQPDRQWLYNKAPAILYTTLESSDKDLAVMVCTGIKSACLRINVVHTIKRMVLNNRQTCNPDVRKTFCRWLDIPYRQQLPRSDTLPAGDESDDSFICDDDEEDVDSN